jgi:GTP cyclohydrolase II
MNHGINIVERMPLVAGVGNDNMEYLATKVEKMGHKISDDALNGN